MINDQPLREMLKRHEGLSLKPYKCPAGRLTIGYGHNIDAKGLPNGIAAYYQEYGEITPRDAEILLTQDIEEALKDCRSLYPGFDGFTINRKRALIDFLFNVGLTTARKFKKANAAINGGDWQTAAAEMKDSQWYTQVRDRAHDIVTLVGGG